MLVISLHRRAQGREVLEHFAHVGADALFVALCNGCLKVKATLTPVELVADAADEVTFSGSCLCEPCMMALPTLPPNRAGGWPEHLTRLEVEWLWCEVRKEQRSEVERQLARAAVSARPQTTLDEFERTCRAAHKAARNQQPEVLAGVA